MRSATIKSTSQTVSSSSYNMRPVPKEIYHNIINSNPKYMNCNTYLLEKYNKIEEIPILNSLFEFLNKDIRSPIPKDHTVNLILGIYTRNKSTHIDPPSENCALRILFNLGYTETYQMDPKYKVGNLVLDSGLPEQNLFMTENTYAILGPVTQSKYKIYVSHESTMELPGNTPLNSGRSTARSRDYKRLTIIVDYIIGDGMVQKLAEVAASKMSNIRVPAGTSKKAIEEQLKKIKASAMADDDLRRKVENIMSPSGPNVSERPSGPNVQQDNSELSEAISQVSDYEREVLSGMNPEEKEEMLKMMQESEKK
jgi:hypothetical protein